jgi:type VI secretion system secreted protein VgrG
MIYRRYHIRAGATTTAGGIVRASSQFCIVNGAPLAREGDPVDCPACGTQGVIKCDMPRLPDRFEGKEYALSDDLCICKCDPPPKLIADQNFKCQTMALASVESA